MEKETIYQLLAARFCHDLASPINAAGLLLETESGSEMQELAQRNHAMLTNILQVYRLLFAHQEDKSLLERAVNVVERIYNAQGVPNKISIKKNPDNSRPPLSNAFIKAFVTVLYLLMPYLQEGALLLVTNDEEGLDQDNQQIFSEMCSGDWEQHEIRSFPERFEAPTFQTFHFQADLFLEFKAQSNFPDVFSFWETAIEPQETSSQNILPRFLRQMQKDSNSFLLGHFAKKETEARSFLMFCSIDPH